MLIIYRHESEEISIEVADDILKSSDAKSNWGFIDKTNNIISGLKALSNSIRVNIGYARFENEHNPEGK